MNDIAYRVLGLTAERGDLGRPFAEVLHELPGSLPRARRPRSRATTCRTAPRCGCARRGRAIGYTLSRIHDDEGAVVGATLFFKDLTRVEQIEERERLRDRLAALGEMAAAIAHEVKNPLASIEVMAGVLKRQLSDQPEALEIARRHHQGSQDGQRHRGGSPRVRPADSAAGRARRRSTR